MLTEEALKSELRLQAIEYLLSNAFVQLYRLNGVPPEAVMKSHEQLLDRLSHETFPTDPATSDMVADELRQAVKRLLEMIQEAMGQRT
jgi:hypothetical protein